MTLMEIDDFDYELPPNLIAQQPPKIRGDSKLIVVNPNKSSLIDSHCKNFYDYLSPKDLLVFNDTRVIKARLFGEKVTGGKVELLIENIIDPNHALTMIKTSKKIHIGLKIFISKSIFLEVTNLSNLFALSNMVIVTSFKCSLTMFFAFTIKIFSLN